MSSITFFVPAFNSASTIKETISSLLNQSIRDFKIFVLDNGSSDNTLEVLNYFKDKRLIIKKYPHTKSLGSSLNRAFDFQIESLFCICHADDLYNPKFAENIIQEFKNNKDLDIVFCNADLIDDSSRIFFSLKNYFKNLINNLFPNFTGRSAVIRLFFFNSLIAPSACFRQNSIYKKIGFNKDFVFYTDVYLWTRLLHQNVKIKCLSYRGIRYRVHNKQLSFSAGRWSKQLNELRSLKKIIEDIYGDNIILKVALPLGIGFRWLFYFVKNVFK